jgi:hypothetical protein
MAKMNRRGFLTSLLRATVGTTVAYSFPSVIVPKNIVQPVMLTDLFPDGIIYGGIGPKGGIIYSGIGPKGLPYLISDSGLYLPVNRNFVNHFKSSILWQNT